jgi:hypothetical protein
MAASGGKYNVEEDLGEVNSGSAEQFDAFLKAALKKYPPTPERQYFLILSDHGGAFKILGTDHVCEAGQDFQKDVCSKLKWSDISACE